MQDISSKPRIPLDSRFVRHHGKGAVPWPPPGTFDLWRIGCVDGAERVLSQEEVQRLGRIVEGEPRASWLAATAGTRVVAGFYLGVEPGRISIRRGSRGKPEIAGGPLFNSTHTTGCVLLAFAREAIGIDAERLARRVNALEIARKFFSEQETLWLQGQTSWEEAFLRLWTRKEAMVKLTGDGLAHGLRGALVGAEGCHCNGRPVSCREYLVDDSCLVTVASWTALTPNNCYELGEFGVG